METQQLYVGNWPREGDHAELEALFLPHGEVCAARIVRDRSSGEPRGFAFVEMAVDAAQAAMEALNGQSYRGRVIEVTPAYDKQPRGPRALRLRRKGATRHA